MVEHSVFPRGRTYLSIVGWLLLILCAAWWMRSYFIGSMVGGQTTWIPAAQLLGYDFFHNFAGTRHWMDGGDPYKESFGDSRGLFSYAPIVLYLFAWCTWVSYWKAFALFALFINVVVGIGAWLSVRFRRANGLVDVPYPLVLGLVLLSMPVLFATERGNCDAWPLALLLVAAWSLQKEPGWTWDIIAGVSIAIAAWVKIYPAIAILGLIALRRYRVVAVAVAAGAIIPLLTWSRTVEFLQTSGTTHPGQAGPISDLIAWFTGARANQALVLTFDPNLLACNHSLTSYWALFWGRLGALRIAEFPGFMMASLILMPLVLWVGHRMYHSKAAATITYPYLLWLAAIGTYLMPLSYDYDLIYLPLLIVAVWDKDDPYAVDVLLALSVIWWQPFAVRGPLVADLMFMIKLVSLFGVTICLLNRIRQGDTARAVAGETQPS